MSADAASEKPIKRMVITGGTHGNESNSVQLAKHFLRNPDAVQRESELEVMCAQAQRLAVARSRGRGLAPLIPFYGLELLVLFCFRGLLGRSSLFAQRRAPFSRVGA